MYLNFTEKTLIFQNQSVLSKKEVKQKLKEQKALDKEQAQLNAEHFNPICNSVMQRLPPGCPEEDYNMFKKIKDLCAEKLRETDKPVKQEPVPETVTTVVTKAGRKSIAKPETSGKLLIDSINQYQQASSRLPGFITFGKYFIETWYSSPYPYEYVQNSVLHICEFCLKYVKSKEVLELHMAKKCSQYNKRFLNKSVNDTMNDTQEMDPEDVCITFSKATDEGKLNS